MHTYTDAYVGRGVITGRTITPYAQVRRCDRHRNWTEKVPGRHVLVDTQRLSSKSTSRVVAAKRDFGRSMSNVISVYPVDGGDPKLLPNLAPNFVPIQWSDDGSSLYGYHAGEIPSRVYRVAFASGKEMPVQELRPGVPAGVVTVAPVVASRDGKKFAYSYNQTLSVLYLISGLR